MSLLFGSHPASVLVAIVVALFAIKLGVHFAKGEGVKPTDGGISNAFFGGVLLVNALAHFTHGISG